MEVIEFEWAGREGTYDAKYSGKDVDDHSGRYVREEDYAKLLERHERTVKALKICVTGLKFLDSQNKGNEHTYQQIRFGEAALAEEE